MKISACPSSSLQANIKEAEVTIPAKLHNSLIGSKGCLVRSIMEDCGGVHIHFPSEGSGSDKVTIRGPAGEVEKAKKQLLQLAEEKVSRKERINRKGDLKQRMLATKSLNTYILLPSTAFRSK